MCLLSSVAFFLYLYFYFVLLASLNKQTKQLRIQMNIGRDTATAVANYREPGY